LLVPDITTTEITVGDRGTKLYLDPNQNDYADTIAAAYSARPYKVPTVSTPIAWKELVDTLDSRDFTISTIHKRLEKKGDLFEGVLDERVAVKNDVALERLLTV
jgi:bifunctional non-homologous end joining protein LigD